jgi:hypothetical protein
MLKIVRSIKIVFMINEIILNFSVQIQLQLELGEKIAYCRSTAVVQSVEQ